MANPFATAWKDFWHTMTSNDRHASHDSAYRTGRHMPLSQSRNGQFGTQATTAMESTTDLTNEGAFAANSLSPPVPQQTPYSPGARSQSVRRGSSDGVNQGEIQMQNFDEGLPPPPPVSHSWKRVDRWAEDNYQELCDQLGEGATNNDINELEHELDCSLPVDVRESIMAHDGQERGGRPTGIIFGAMLLDCEEIVQEWRNWRTVNEEYLMAAPSGSVSINMANSKSMAGPSVGSSSESAQPSKGMPTSTGPNPLWRQELLDRQESQPARAIQKAYAHPGWIPMVRDWGGNNIAVDLAPGPTGKWGQVIIFGRDYDCKYVIARSWGAFMAQLADDFGSGKAEIDEDSEWDGKLRLKQFKEVDPPYFEILRWRADQKYGRRFPKRKGPGPGAAANGKRGSPYGSPVDERGRSPQRFPAAGVGSPARVGSPLAKVDEEGKVEIAKPRALNPTAISKLVDAPTPVVSSTDLISDVAEAKAESQTDSAGSKVGLGVDVLEGEMKTVAI